MALRVPGSLRARRRGGHCAHKGGQAAFAKNSALTVDAILRDMVTAICYTFLQIFLSV